MSATPERITREFTVTAELKPLAELALLLERLDRTRREASPEQYRFVVQNLTRLLQQATPGPLLDQLVAAFPGTAELYENLNYAAAGLCRSPLEQSLNAELDARQLISRARQRPPTRH